MIKWKGFCHFEPPMLADMTQKKIRNQNKKSSWVYLTVLLNEPGGGTQAILWLCIGLVRPWPPEELIPRLKDWKDQADSSHLRCLSGSVALTAAEWKRGMLWSLFLNKSPRYLKGCDNTIYSTAKPKPTTHQVPWWLAVFFLPPRMCSAL